jgi:hypothetical protein
MAKIKIRHGLAFYNTVVDGKEVEQTAFRNQIVDVSDKEATRLKRLGAAVDEGTELTLPGRIMPLPNTASDEELLAWVSVANAEDVAAEMKKNPGLKDRLDNAVNVFEDRMAAQRDLLSGLKGDIEDAHSAAQLPDEDEEEFDEDDPREVVKGNVDKVSAWLSEHPDQFDAVLQAEQERRQKENKEPRDGVVRAVQAAAAHQSSQ